METSRKKPTYTRRPKRTNAVYVAAWSQDGQVLNKGVVQQIEAAVETIVKENGLLFTSGRE